MKSLENFEDAVALLRSGAVGVIPTDTIYGLVASAHDQQAVQRIYELKQRDGKPGTIIAASIEQLVALGLKKRYLTAVEQYWPGAISIIIPCFELGYLHQGKGSIPVRIPADEQLRNFLEQTGPLQTSSANLTGQPGATTLSQAQGYFGNQVDFYVDGGDLSKKEPSTIIRVVDDAVEVIREGAVKIDEETGRVIS